MAKKKNKNKNNNDDKSIEADKKEEDTKTSGADAEEKKEKPKKEDNNKNNNKSKNATEPVTVVLKTDMHCEGCASKISKAAKSIPGVESAKADFKASKITVTGKVDPLKVRDSLHDKTKKKVDLVSPLPAPSTKEDKTNNNNNKKEEKKQDNTEKKPKEPPVTTAVIKMPFHCHGCLDKIHRTISKFKGVQEIVKVDKEKETFTVKGTMDVKALTEALKDKLKRPVEVVPPKEDEKKKEKKDNAGEKDGGGSGGGKKKGGGGGQEGGGQDNAGAADIGRMEVMPGFGYVPYGYGPGFGYMGQPVYGNGYMAQPVYGSANVGQPVYMQGPDPGYGYPYGQGHVPVPGFPVHLRFNDENPNACSIM